MGGRFPSLLKTGMYKRQALELWLGLFKEKFKTKEFVVLLASYSSCLLPLSPFC